MVYPSHYNDKPFKRKKYKYKRHNNDNHKYDTYNSKKSYYSGLNRSYPNYNDYKYNGRISKSSPITSQSFQRVNNASTSNLVPPQKTNNIVTSPKQSRYQPHLSSPIITTPISKHSLNNNIITESSWGKSRYNPTSTGTYPKVTYNKYSPYRDSPSRWRPSRYQDNEFDDNCYETSPHYKRRKRYKKTVPSLHSQFRSLYSSITQSYIKPQAKIRHIYSHYPIPRSFNNTVSTPRRLSNNSDSASIEPQIINSIDITNTPLSPTSENERFLSSKEPSVSLKKKDSEELEETSDDDAEPIQFKLLPQLHDYSHINDPALLKTSILDPLTEPSFQHYPKNCPTYSKYIFPLNRLETKLWHLKHQLRNHEVERSKYILNQPFTSLSQYPCYYSNITNKCNFQSCTNSILALKHLTIRNELNYRKKYTQNKTLWNKQCEEAKISSETLRDKLNLSFMDHKPKFNLNSNDSSEPNHLNRGDYVNDDELDAIMCEIDPGYKFNKQAANISAMISSPLERNDVHFVNVNNLFTNKNKWASRLVSDKVDTFTNHEQDLFLKGYLKFPKRFERISDYMGGLRTSEECILHYYRTKKTVNYKNLIKERNMSRIKSRIKSVKNISIVEAKEESLDAAFSLDSDAILEEEAVEEEDEEDMEENEDFEDSSD